MRSRTVSMEFVFAAMVTAIVHVTVTVASALAAEPTDQHRPSPAADKALEWQRVSRDGSYKQHLQWSPDGQRFLFTRIHQGKMALWTMKIDGSELKRLLPDHKEPHFDGHWSPDGKKVAYVYDQLQGTDGKLRIHVCNADGSDDKTIIPHKAFEESPRWSPDGRRLLWVSTRHGNPELCSVTSDGKDEKRLTNEIAADLHPAWSPDGKSIAFSSGRSGKQKIHTAAADGSRVTRLTEGDYLDSWPTWSPDGRQLAYVSNKSGVLNIWLMSADGSGASNLTRSEFTHTSPCWSPDGKKMACISNRDGGSDIYIHTFR